MLSIARPVFLHLSFARTLCDVSCLGTWAPHDLPGDIICAQMTPPSRLLVSAIMLSTLGTGLGIPVRPRDQRTEVKVQDDRGRAGETVPSAVTLHGIPIPRTRHCPPPTLSPVHPLARPDQQRIARHPCTCRPVLEGIRSLSSESGRRPCLTLSLTAPSQAPPPLWAVAGRQRSPCVARDVFDSMASPLPFPVPSYGPATPRACK